MTSRSPTTRAGRGGAAAEGRLLLLKARRRRAERPARGRTIQVLFEFVIAGRSGADGRGDAAAARWRRARHLAVPPALRADRLGEQHEGLSIARGRLVRRRAQQQAKADRSWSDLRPGDKGERADRGRRASRGGQARRRHRRGGQSRHLVEAERQGRQVRPAHRCAFWIAGMSTASRTSARFDGGAAAEDFLLSQHAFVVGREPSFDHQRGDRATPRPRHEGCRATTSLIASDVGDPLRSFTPPAPVSAG